MGVDICGFDGLNLRVQSEQSEDIQMLFPERCGVMPGKVVESCRSRYRFEAEVEQMAP